MSDRPDKEKYDTASESTKTMSFIEHLEELRSILIKAFLGTGVFVIISLFFSKKLFELLAAPLRKALPEGTPLVFTSVPEPFFTYLHVAVIAGIICASPYIFYQIWRFIAPGLYGHEKKYAIPFVGISSVLFITGALFGYSQVFPLGFKFFINLTPDYIQPMIQIKDYLKFSTRLLLAFGIVFELPLVIIFLTRIGIVTPDALAKKRKYVLLITVIAGAFLTPPDVITQLMMAGPIFVLFEISLIVSRFLAKKKKEKD